VARSSLEGGREEKGEIDWKRLLTTEGVLAKTDEGKAFAIIKSLLGGQLRTSTGEKGMDRRKKNLK